MQSVAVGWQIYNLTHDPLDLGLAALAQFVPALALMLLAGHAADRYPPPHRAARLAGPCRRSPWRRWPSGRRAAGSRASSSSPRWHCSEPPRRSNRRHSAACCPPSCRPALFPRAVAGSASANQLATIAGPALGGFLFVVSPSGTYGLCVVLLLAAGLCLTLIPPPAPLARAQKFSLGGLFAGFTYIRQQPIVLGAISLDLFAVLLGGTLGLLPVFARDILSVGAWGPRPPARLPGRRRALDVARIGDLAAAPACRAHHVCVGCDLRAGDDRVRALHLAAALDGRAGGARLGRRGQRRHPLDAGAAGDARRHAGAASAPSIRCSSAPRTSSATSAPASWRPGSAPCRRC